ncbi:hypothetical protein KW448_08045 [Vibrio fluvialis]|nr:hypothetical protein [Vibrio fluvialis]
MKKNRILAERYELSIMVSNNLSDAKLIIDRHRAIEERRVRAFLELKDVGRKLKAAFAPDTKGFLDAIRAMNVVKNDGGKRHGKE